ncbi:MAG TPA: glycosyltransferase [Candidatus Acidoferrales bacterium]|nr:glycosyltransferase [Candidatus Acidoferrales bacterium]
MNSASGWGGGERMFLELALGFGEAGHSVTVVTRPSAVLAARLPANVNACLLPCRGDLDVLSLLKLFRLFRERRFAAVFCNQGRDCMLAGLAALPSGIPVVRVKAMEDTRRNPRNLLMYRYLLSAVVCVSQAVQLGLADLRLRSLHSVIIPNGIEIPPPSVDRAAARARFGIAIDQFVVAFSGRFVHEKGVDLLPAIAAKVVAQGLPLRLLVAGDGPLRPAVEAEVERRGLSEVVSFLGFLDDPLPVLVAADAALMPSRTEAFPVAALESLALGVPLVACRAGGVVEIVTDGETALLAAPEDVDGLAVALLQLHREPQLAERLRSRGRARASELSRPRMIQSYEALVRQVATRAAI